MTLGGVPSQLAFSDHMSVTVTITYVAAPDDDQATTSSSEGGTPPLRPITLHTWPFTDAERSLTLFRQQQEQAGGEEWEAIESEDGCMGFRIVDNPPVRTTAGSSEHHVHGHDAFVSLAPGASWTATHEVHRGRWDWTDLPGDARPGQRFRYALERTKVDWWAWGARDEHVDTEIFLPDWINGPALEEDGKPRRRREGDPPEIFVEEATSDEFVFTG